MAAKKEIIRIVTPEACQVAREILERFSRWAKASIAAYNAIPREVGSEVRREGQIDAMVYAERNLTQIVRDVTGVEE